jgi:hypothetical protein
VVEKEEAVPVLESKQQGTQPESSGHPPGNASKLRPVKGGIMAGIVGGAALAVLTIVLSAVRGREIWPALKGAAMPFLGERAAEPGFELVPVLAGLACHFAVSIVWGLLFALFAYGLGVWLGMFYVVLPIVGLGELARMTPMATAILEHVFFGVAVALGFLPYQRTARPPERRAAHP